MDLDHNQIMKRIICHNDFIDFDIMAMGFVTGLKNNYCFYLL